MRWEPVIGLEVHVQLATRSKLFSSSAVDFGAPPNTRASAVDIALPGVLPVLNGEAVRMAVLFGLAVDARVARRSVFARKNYFYPDLPRGYQISQYEEPLVQGGHISFQLPDGEQKETPLVRAHLEEDAGKSLHDRFADCTAIDLNRAGVPLLEIVTAPAMHSAAEAVACLRGLHSLVCALEICDGDMSQGSLRCDVNVSLRPAGETTLGVRTETKNLNSFRFVERAILGEIARQTEILESGGQVRQQTRLYDELRDESRPMRSKEEEQDYRYFPDPDLLPLCIEEEEIEHLRNSLPELPRARCARLARQYSLGEKEAAALAADRDTADFFERGMQHCGHARSLANWICGELTAWLHRHDCAIADAPVAPRELAQLVERIADGTISGKIAKEVFADLWQEAGEKQGEGVREKQGEKQEAGEVESQAESQEGQRVDALIERKGLRQLSDDALLTALVEETLDRHAEQLRKYRAAPAEKRKRMLGFFVGQAMKQSGGKANPEQLNRILVQRLEREEGEAGGS